MTQDEIREMEGQIKVEIAQAAQAAKMRGKLSGALQDMVAGMLESKTPWYEILEKHCVARVNQGQSWRRPNRRFADVYLPVALNDNRHIGVCRRHGNVSSIATGIGDWRRCDFGVKLDIQVCFVCSLVMGELGCTANLLDITHPSGRDNTLEVQVLTPHHRFIVMGYITER